MDKVKVGPAAIMSAAAMMLGSQECLRSDSDMIMAMRGEKSNRYRKSRIQEIVSLSIDLAHEVERQMSEDSRIHP